MTNRRVEDQQAKRTAARMSLPEDLRPALDQLAEAYKNAALVHYGKPFVSYPILADIIYAGWRLTAAPLDEQLQQDKPKN